jgi:hypothetical protein
LPQRACPVALHAAGHQGQYKAPADSMMRYYPHELMSAAIVVALDMRSSSLIFDDLAATKNLDRLGGFISSIKHFLADEAQIKRGLRFAPHKFSGDAWILLFFSDTDGAANRIDVLPYLSLYCFNEAQARLASCNVRWRPAHLYCAEASQGRVAHTAPIVQRSGRVTHLRRSQRPSSNCIEGD